jgi:hypothetical protein
LHLSYIHRKNYRIEAGKMAGILEIARSIVPNDAIDIEIEYEDTVISQYPVQGATVSEDAVTLVLTTRHTGCLTRELCLVPSDSSSGC